MRRVILLAAGVLLAAFVQVAAPALSTTPWIPRAVDFELAVPATSGHAARAAVAAGHTVLTPVLRPAKRFDLVGFRWRTPVRANVRVRLHKAGGRWSHWMTAGDAEDHSHRLYGTEPVWAKDSDALQVRVPRALKGFRAHFVNTTGSATAADRARTAIRSAVHSAFVSLALPVARAAGAHVADGVPAIVPRSAWGADQCKPRNDPSYGEVDVALVHHTESSNDYSPADSKAIVLAICRYHRNSNGWSDIGYNFLVDRYGTIFEGRQGGTTKPVIGAQAQGYNSHSTGISVIGSFMTSPPPPAATTAVAQLIRWKLGLTNTPTQGTTTLISGGGSLNAHPYGAKVVMNRISGHRDGDSTDCPGDAFYAALPALRREVAGLPPATGLTAGAEQSQIVVGDPATLTGRLALPEGAPPAGTPIEVQRRTTTRHWLTIATVQTDATGAWSAEVRASTNRRYRALWRGDALHPIARSPSVLIHVIAQLTVGVTSGRVSAGHAARLHGTTKPKLRRVTLLISRRGHAAKYAAYATRKVTVKNGRWRLTLGFAKAGLYRIQASVKPDATTAGGNSDPVFVRKLSVSFGSGGAGAGAG